MHRWDSAGSGAATSTARSRVSITSPWIIAAGVAVLCISAVLCCERQEQEDAVLFLDTWVAGTQCPEPRSWERALSRAPLRCDLGLLTQRLDALHLAPLGHTVFTHVFHLLTAEPGGARTHSLQGSEYTLVLLRQRVKGRHQVVWFNVLPGVFVMDDGAESLMTVHLLTHLGHSFPLQQTLDRLLEWLCLDIRLFLVSERVPPLKYYERYRKRSRSFPGISILLFLHEGLGEERIFQVHEQFQRPPWRHQRARLASGQSPPCAPCQQDFYGLEEQLPVWGIRRVPRGPEILRVTLYCSFDNYEDAVRLYELLLQREGTLHKSTVCVFVLHATPHVAVQLCLEQLPVGVAAEPPGSAALQFSVQQIGQLVPLLPNPCAPISSTRWQTQDYEGNTILLKVQSSARTLETNIGLSQQHGNTGSGRIPQDCVPAPLSVKQGTPGRRSQELRAAKGKSRCDPSEAAGSERAGGALQGPLGSERAGGALQGPLGSAAAAPWLRGQAGRAPRAPLAGSRGQRAPETDVDTGLAVGSTGSGRCPLSLFAGALRSSLPLAPGAARPGAARRGAAASGTGTAALGAPGRAAPPCPAPPAGHEEELEFFI